MRPRPRRPRRAFASVTRGRCAWRAVVYTALVVHTGLVLEVCWAGPWRQGAAAGPWAVDSASQGAAGDTRLLGPYWRKRGMGELLAPNAARAFARHLKLVSKGFSGVGQIATD
jgi:hypothetical protein